MAELAMEDGQMADLTSRSSKLPDRLLTCLEGHRPSAAIRSSPFAEAQSLATTLNEELKKVELGSTPLVSSLSQPLPFPIPLHLRSLPTDILALPLEHTHTLAEQHEACFSCHPCCSATAGCLLRGRSRASRGLVRWHQAWRIMGASSHGLDIEQVTSTS